MEMKKTLYISALAGLLLSFGSCNLEQDRIWEDSSAIRMQKTIEKYSEILTGAPNGWGMEYFASPSEGGYNFVFKFDKNGSVTVGGKNAVSTGGKYKEATSLWEYIKDNGPVLTLNTYNDVFHPFADPDPSHSGESDGFGHAGDYEFITISACPDSVILLGKKTNNKICLYPLTSPNGEDYFKFLEEQEAKFFNPSLPNIWLDASGERYTAVVDVASRTISYVPEGGDPITETTHSVYGMTNNGIKLFAPYGGMSGNFAVQDFVYVEDKGLLLSKEDGKTFFSAGSMGDVFMNKKILWRTSKENVSGQLATIYDNVVSQCKKILRKNFNYFEFTYNSIAESYVLGFKNGTYSGYFKATYSVQDNVAKFNITDEGNQNAMAHYKNIPAMKEFIDFLNANEFVVTAPNALNPVPMKFTSKANENDFFTVSAN